MQEEKIEKRLSIPFLIAFSLLLLLVSYSSWHYLSDGLTFRYDGIAHTARVHFVSKSLQKLQWPLWTNEWYCGYPLMQFYSPLFFLIAGATELITHDPVTAVKIVLFAANILSGITIFFLASTLCRNYVAGIFSALIYAMAPWHFMQIMDYGRFPVSFIYAFLPLPFLFYELYRSNLLCFKKSAILSGCSIALLVLSHYGYTLICVYIFVLWYPRCLFCWLG